MAERDAMRREGGRVHMGTATSDPDYLPQTEFQKRIDREMGVQGAPVAAGSAAPAPTTSPHAPKQTLRGNRYLSTPKGGKAIFTRQERHRRHTRLALAALLVVAVALIVCWFFFLR